MDVLQNFIIQDIHERSDVFKGIIEKLYPIAQHLTGESNLNVLNMQLFEKHPMIGKPTGLIKIMPISKYHTQTPLHFGLH